MNESTLSSKLKSRRLELELTLEEVANQVGVTKSTVRKWETGSIENMKRDKIALLAKALNVSPLYIMGIDETNSNGTIQIPLIGTIAAGSPIFADENIQDYYNIDSKVKADFALTVKGDSMIKACIFDGDLAFIKQQPTLENGEIGAFLLNGDEATLKRFYKKDNEIKLFAENDSEEYRINWPKTITPNEVDGFRILGKLVGVYSNREHK